MRMNLKKYTLSSILQTMTGYRVQKPATLPSLRMARRPAEKRMKGGIQSVFFVSSKHEKKLSEVCYLRMMIFSQWKDTMDDNNQTSGQPKPEPEECVKEQKNNRSF